MYHNGVNIPIYVSTSGTLTAADYIEFMGRKNTGELETSLYEDSYYQMHNLFSLFTDTSSFYLTYNSSSSSSQIYKYAKRYDFFTSKRRLFYLYCS
jgi:hypothetical protein